MLNWFPTPYPGELWYSVLCRFYISTGIREASIVKKLLFGKRGNIKMATLYPNASVHLVTSRLPPNTLDPKDIILENENVLHRCAELLLEKERISRDEFEALFNDGETDPEPENEVIPEYAPGINFS